MRQTLRLLMSQHALDATAAERAAFDAEHASSHTLEWVSIEAALAAQRRDLDAAFISREVTGASTKHEIHPELQAVYDLLLANQGLRWVHIHSAGADRAVYVALKARGVQISTSSGANAPVVAASALAGMLALARRLPLLWREQQARAWIPLMGPGRMPRDLPGQTVCVIGWGPIGQQLARLVKALDMRVIAVRTQARPDEDGVRMVGFAQLHEALAQSDWLVLACPLTAQTQQLIGARELRAMPAGAHLINVARGECVRQDELCEVLQSGHLGGAYLDVFAHEPLPQDSPLWFMPQVLVTPHAAGHSDGNEGRVQAMFWQGLRRWLQGGA